MISNTKMPQRNALYTSIDIENQFASIMSSMVRKFSLLKLEMLFISHCSLMKKKSSKRKSRCQLPYVTCRIVKHIPTVYWINSLDAASLVIL